VPLRGNNSRCCCTANCPSTTRSGWKSHLEACTECSAGFEREKSLHASLDGVEITPSPSLLRVCREELRARLIEESVMPRAAARAGWWEQFTDMLTGRKAGVDSGMRAAADSSGNRRRR
jgi:hypothetical protein